MAATAVLGTLIAGGIGIMYNEFKPELGPVFTVDASVQRTVTSLVPIMTVMLVGDAWICVFSGTLASAQFPPRMIGVLHNLVEAVIDLFRYP